MERIPEEDRQCLGEITATQEDLALQEFYNQLTRLLNSYLGSPLVADTSHRSRRALCALANVTDDVNKRAQDATLLN
jgi:hypothetical protein